ncbi:MAG TPA: Holliday junction resolvase RuvX [Terriglobia bacterium]|nr:Holliday junction resolvase RuvX [Terriglobia bacterium]HEX5482827.1 Holliday junction resolvase RuvX [Terriglobia bacterium]
MTQGRILAVDFGLRRLGVAASDPLGIVAQGLPTVQRKNMAADLAALEALAEEYSVVEVILGNPLSQSGEETAISRRVEAFAEKLRRRLSCPVKLWDERLTSAEANRMLRSSGMGLRKRQRAVDQVSAVLILQNYLDWRANQVAGAENNRVTV